MKRGFVKLLFGVTRLANGQFMVQSVYINGDSSTTPKKIGIYDVASEANRWYREHAPNNVTTR